jgi:Hemerythrin HHE cation binding domain
MGIDTSDMLAVHGAFRATLPGAAALVAEADPGDAARAAVVANFYDNVLDFLDSHHGGEDELIWPLLFERCPEEAAYVRTVASQHEEVVELIGRARGQLAEWAVAGDEAAGTVAAATLSELAACLAPHMDEEETSILPMCSEHIRDEEWAQLPVHGFSHFHGDKPWVVLGLLLEQAGPERAEIMMARMPLPAQEMWTGFGKSAFDALSTELGRS